MTGLKTTYLGEFIAEIEQPTMVIGATPGGMRMIANVLGGVFEGPRVKGTVARSGGDWLTVRADGSIAIDVRAAVTSHDGHMIYVSYCGRLVMPPEAMAALGDPVATEKLDPSSYYFRTAPLFEAAMDGPYAWLNHVVTVGVGKLTPHGVQYTIHQVL
ncbi:MAG: DUF3237 domain-containing protein [Alphaproteobacteria bacterium]